MATLREIRNRVVTVKNTAKITSAMKMVAAAKLRRAQDAILSARPYTTKMTEILQNLAAAVPDDYFHPLLQVRPVKTIAVIVVSSDRGLCGSFNSNLLRIAANYIKHDLPVLHKGSTPHVITVGKRSTSFFSKTKLEIDAKFPDVFQRLQFETAHELSELITQGFTAEKYDKVVIINNEFKSIIKQEVVIRQLLPLEKSKGGDANATDYIFEPSREDILDVLLPRYLTIQVWRSLLESNAAEQAARMMAMDNATTNARDLIDSLQLKYNKARQAAITKEMLEIVGGAEALRG